MPSPEFVEYLAGRLGLEHNQLTDLWKRGQLGSGVSGQDDVEYPDVGLTSLDVTLRLHADFVGLDVIGIVRVFGGRPESYMLRVPDPRRAGTGDPKVLAARRRRSLKDAGAVRVLDGAREIDRDVRGGHVVLHIYFGDPLLIGSEHRFVVRAELPVEATPVGGHAVDGGPYAVGRKLAVRVRPGLEQVSLRVQFDEENLPTVHRVQVDAPEEWPSWQSINSQASDDILVTPDRFGLATTYYSGMAPGQLVGLLWYWNPVNPFAHGDPPGSYFE